MYILTNDEDLTWSTKMGYYFTDWFSLSASSDEDFAYRLQWGPNRYSANTALLAAVFAKYDSDGDYASHEHALWAASQVSNIIMIERCRRDRRRRRRRRNRNRHGPYTQTRARNIPTPSDRLHARLQRCVQIVRHRLR